MVVMLEFPRVTVLLTVVDEVLAPHPRTRLLHPLVRSVPEAPLPITVLELPVMH
jgi:hypothetical protein